jgi:hypothetical protein
MFFWTRISFALIHGYTLLLFHTIERLDKFRVCIFVSVPDRLGVSALW